MAKKHGGGATFYEKTIKLLESFSSIPFSKVDNKLLCNNYDVMKFFSDKDFKIMNVNITSEFTGEMHFNEIFPEFYGAFSMKAISHFLKMYKINWFILDQKKLEKKIFENEVSLSFTEMASVYHYTIYKVC